jgi:hypothetical protein
MIMAIIIKTVMSGLFAATVLAVVGTSASAAFSPRDLGIRQTQIAQQSQALDKSQPVQKAAWSEEDQRSFWEQEGDRGG